jgi:hypothetical protein
LHGRREYERAKPLLSRVLQAYADTGGGTTGEAIKRAWALFDAQLRTGDVTGAAATREHYLEGLLGAVEEDVPEELLGIREDVLRRLKT